MIVLGLARKLGYTEVAGALSLALTALPVVLLGFAEDLTLHDKLPIAFCPRRYATQGL